MKKGVYKVKKRLEISASHNIETFGASKCNELHGHNWIITIYCKSEKLDEFGMVIDFEEIKRRIMDKLDHKYLNDQVEFNPTAENIARWCVEQIKKAYKCEVQESEGNTASFELI